MGEATGEGGSGFGRRGGLIGLAVTALAAVGLGRASQSDRHSEVAAQKQVQYDADTANEAMRHLRPYDRKNFKVATLANVQPREQKGTMDDPITAPTAWDAAQKGYGQDIWKRHPFSSSLEPDIKQGSGVDSFIAGDQIVLPDPDMIGHFFAVKKGERVPGYEELGVFTGFNANEVRFKKEGGVAEDKISFEETFQKNGDRFNFVVGLKGQTERLVMVREPLIQESAKK